MKLLDRSEYFKWKSDEQKTSEPVYHSKESHDYTASLLRNLFHNPEKSSILSVKNLEFANNTRTYTIGQSLERWSTKRPRLKSGEKGRNAVCRHFEERDDNACDITEILSNLDNNKEDSKEESTEYELNSDIEELWQRSQGSEADTDDIRQKSSRSRDHNKSKIKIKQKLKKKIRFSFSKPASPQTEQVIRVDVSSNILVDELRQMGISNGNCNAHLHCKGGSDQLFRSDEMKSENKQQDFLIRCSQLALEPKN
ncbi:hypothetical protein JTB14_035082 [Gonioctena quinquepunctata]|nr:hypothetical protein JTB14_035082 [Gonioctena quinquepunctata]